jgi:hypothetical protein
MEYEPTTSGAPFCRACGLPKDVDGTKGLCARCSSDARKLPDWVKAVGEDDWDEGGTVAQIVVAHARTAAAVLLHPGRFFSELALETGNLPSIVYGAVFGTLGLAGAIGSSWVAGVIHPSIPPLGGFALVLGFLLFMGPFVLAATGQLAYALVPRLIGRRGVTDATLRVFAYSWGSTWAFYWIPVVGIPVGVAWALVASFLGFRCLMKLTRFQAVCATLVGPSVVAILFVLGVVAALAAT